MVQQATASPSGSGNPCKKPTNAYGYFVKMCYEEHKKKYPNEHVQVTEISKKCSQKWKEMTDDEKRRFYELAQKDTERYQAEMTMFGDDFRRRKRQKKDPCAPKRALSAFFFFSQVTRPEIQADHPDWRVGQIAQELGRRWKEFTPEEKMKYEDMASNDRERYEAEMKDYKAGRPVASRQRAMQQQAALAAQHQRTQQLHAAMQQMAAAGNLMQPQGGSNVSPSGNPQDLSKLMAAQVAMQQQQQQNSAGQGLQNASMMGGGGGTFANQTGAPVVSAATEQMMQQLQQQTAGGVNADPTSLLAAAVAVVQNHQQQQQGAQQQQMGGMDQSGLQQQHQMGASSQEQQMMAAALASTTHASFLNPQTSSPNAPIGAVPSSVNGPVQADAMLNQQVQGASNGTYPQQQMVKTEGMNIQNAQDCVQAQVSMATADNNAGMLEVPTSSPAMVGYQQMPSQQAGHQGVPNHVDPAAGGADQGTPPEQSSAPADDNLQQQSTGEDPADAQQQSWAGGEPPASESAAPAAPETTQDQSNPPPDAENAEGSNPPAPKGDAASTDSQQ